MPFLVTAEDIASSIIKTNAAAQGVDGDLLVRIGGGRAQRRKRGRG